MTQPVISKRPTRPEQSTGARRARRIERSDRVRLAASREFIDRHYAKPLRIPGLARIAGLSTFHFIRAFRRLTGETPHQYLRSRRIVRARELLVSTPMSVTDIGQAVGFQSLGSFSSVFRKLTGESPVGYRAARRRTPYIPGCFVRMYRAE